MSGTLEGKVAIITGGSKGIGQATARRFAKNGAKVVINYSSDSAAAEALVAELGADRTLAVQANAGSLTGIDAIVATTVQRFGRIDIVVANAGVSKMCDLASTTEDDFDRSFQINVKGPYFLAQKAVPHMSAGGRIILLSTSVTIHSAVSPDYLLYTATKGAIEQMTRVMARDLGQKGITVNAVAPGPTRTELFLKGKPDSVVKAIESWHPQGRIADPDEIAEVITFASSEHGRWMSGQVLFTNGASIV